MPQPLAVVGLTEEILILIRVLETRDHLVKRNIRVLGSVAVCCWIGLALSLIAALSLWVLDDATSDNHTRILLLYASGVCLLLGIIYSVRRYGWKNEDMESRRLALVRQFFTMLGRDIPCTKRCALNMGFDDYQQYCKMVADWTSGPLGIVRHSKFVDKWFTARGQLLDGNRFKVTVTQVVRRKEIPILNYRKIIERMTEDITLLLKIDPQTYPHSGNITLLRGASINGVQLTRVWVQDGLVRVTCTTPMAVRKTRKQGVSTYGFEQLASGDTLLKLFLVVYAELQKCRAPQTTA